MTTTEFKEKYPQYKNLEGDDLWNIMEDTLLKSSNVLIADPQREIIYHDPLEIKGVKWFVEDDNKTRWLNSKGEEIFIKNEKTLKEPTESYKLEIVDFGDK